MSDGPIYLTPADAQAMGEAVRFARRTSREARNVTPVASSSSNVVQSVLWPVKVTGAPITVDPATGDASSSSGAIDLYPAVWLRPNAVGTSFDDQDEVWLLPLANATFATGDETLARLAGRRDVDGVPVYVGGAPAPASSFFVCVAATTAALPANTYNNGSSGIGATLTGSANGILPAIDGFGVGANELLLVKNESNSDYNGVYTITQAGDSTHPYILTRAPGADTTDGLGKAFVKVSYGATYAGTLWYLASAVSPVGAAIIAWIETGTVNGPASSTDTAIALFNGTSGRLLRNSTVTIDASGNVAGPQIPTSPPGNPYWSIATPGKFSALGGSGAGFFAPTTFGTGNLLSTSGLALADSGITIDASYGHNVGIDITGATCHVACYGPISTGAAGLFLSAPGSGVPSGVALYSDLGFGIGAHNPGVKFLAASGGNPAYFGLDATYYTESPYGYLLTGYGGTAAGIGAPVFAITSGGGHTPGVSGTDPVGNVFNGGIITTISSSGGYLTSSGVGAGSLS